MVLPISPLGRLGSLGPERIRNIRLARLKYGALWSYRPVDETRGGLWVLELRPVLTLLFLAHRSGQHTLVITALVVAGTSW